MHYTISLINQESIQMFESVEFETKEEAREFASKIATINPDLVLILHTWGDGYTNIEGEYIEALTWEDSETIYGELKDDGSSDELLERDFGE